MESCRRCGSHDHERDDCDYVYPEDRVPFYEDNRDRDTGTNTDRNEG